MAIRMKTTVTQRGTAECPTHSLTRWTTRDVTCTIDEPEERGGTNEGPAPTETAVAALVGCTNTIGHKCAAKLGVEMGALTIASRASLDRRGVLLEEEIDLPFPDVTLDVHAHGPATQAEMDRVGEMTAKFCAVSKLFVAAGTRVTVNWHARE